MCADTYADAFSLFFTSLLLLCPLSFGVVLRSYSSVVLQSLLLSSLSSHCIAPLVSFIFSLSLFSAPCCSQIVTHTPFKQTHFSNFALSLCMLNVSGEC